MLQVPAGRLHRADGRRPDRRELVHDPDAPQLGRVVPRPRLLPPLHHAGRRPRSTTCWPAASRRCCCSSARRRWSTCSTRAKDAFDIILQIGAGTGLLYLVRWFWWRVNAWCEIVAMISSFLDVGGAAGPREERRGLQHARGAAHDDCRDDGVLGGDGVCGPQTDRDVLIRFCRMVRPFGPGWTEIRRAAGLPADDRASPDNIPLALPAGSPAARPSGPASSPDWQLVVRQGTDVSRSVRRSSS